LHTAAATRHLEVTAGRLGLYLVHESECQGAPGASGRGEAIWSSPAIGEVGGQLVAAVGTSFYDAPYTPLTDRLYVYPVSSTVPLHWEPVWTGTTPGPVLGSPAIGELPDPSPGSPVAGLVDTSFDCPNPPQSRETCLGTGLSEVQAWVPPASGKAGLLTQLWARTLPGGDSLASPVLVPLRGERTDDVLVGSGGGLFPLDGATGAFLYGTGTDPPQLAIHSACILFNAPAVADVLGPGPYGGWYAYELCSYGGGAQGGGLFAYKLPQAPASTPGWPMFRGDPSHSGVSWSTLGRGSPPGDPTH
jgi:hypothetical protein